MIEALTGQGINVRHACRVLGVSESGYYDWKDRPASQRALRRIWLAGEIADIHRASGGTYGALRVGAELRYGRDIIVGHNAVESIMRELGLKGVPTRRLPKGARVGNVSSLDLVRRSFARRRQATGRRGPQHGLVIHSDRGVRRWIQWSSQHLERGGVDGQARQGGSWR